MKIATIIVTFNGEQWIDQCLLSLEQSTIPVDCIIVDNGSTDNTLSLIAKHPSLTLFRTDCNLGFGQANNLALNYVLSQGYTHILLLNQDAWIANNMLEQLLAFDDGKSLLSPMHMRGDGTDLDRNFKMNSLAPVSLIRVDEYTPLTKKEIEALPETFTTREIPAAIWFLPVTIVHEIGGFNPLFFHYAEDINYLQRLQFFSTPKRIVRDAIAYHCRENNPPKPLTEQRVYQEIILHLTNINHSYLICLLHVIRYGLAMVHLSWQRCSITPLIFFFRATISTLLKSARIQNSRWREKNTYCTWLTPQMNR